MSDSQTTAEPVSRRYWLQRQVLAASAIGVTGLGLGIPTAAQAAENTPVATPNTSTVAQPGKTPHTRFAVNVEMWWTKLPLLERLRQAVALGFPAVEFWPWQGKDIAEMAKFGAGEGLAFAQFTAWGFTPGLNDPANHTRFVDAIKKGCDIAHQLDCKLMTVVGGNDQPGMTQTQMHQNIIDGLRLAAPVAEQADVTLILEPMNIRVDHKGHCLYGSEAPVHICREVGSKHVKINWDLYHMQITEGDLCRRLKEGWDQVGYLQLADNPGRNEPGTGEIYYPAVLKTAYDLGYRGFVGLECRPKQGEDLAAQRVYQADWQ